MRMTVRKDSRPANSIVSSDVASVVTKHVFPVLEIKWTGKFF
jgi:hypothetical protein